MGKAYYNEFNPESAAMLRQLIKDGHCAPGEVDERSITEVKPHELSDFTQCHFFAGIGGWSMALRLAEWPDDKPVWTGSAPCQPFSTAGRQKGKTDDRHLFPVWMRLIRECHPPTIFGEQVAAAVAHGWLDDVYQGLEAEGYAVGAAVLPACSVGAPHRRERLWFVAHAESQRSGGTAGASGQEVGRPSTNNGLQSGRASDDGFVADANQRGCPLEQHTRSGSAQNCRGKSDAFTHGGVVDDAQQPRLEGHGGDGGAEGGWPVEGGPVTEAGFWSSGEWLDCPDGKARLVEPRIPLLVNGFQHRRPILHALGNAIVPQVAAEFIKASM